MAGCLRHSEPGLLEETISGEFIFLLSADQGATTMRDLEALAGAIAEREHRSAEKCEKDELAQHSLGWRSCSCKWEKELSFVSLLARTFLPGTCILMYSLH